MSVHHTYGRLLPALLPAVVLQSCLQVPVPVLPALWWGPHYRLHHRARGLGGAGVFGDLGAGVFLVQLLHRPAMLLGTLEGVEQLLDFVGHGAIFTLHVEMGDLVTEGERKREGGRRRVKEGGEREGGGEEREEGKRGEREEEKGRRREGGGEREEREEGGERGRREREEEREGGGERGEEEEERGGGGERGRRREGEEEREGGGERGRRREREEERGGGGERGRRREGEEEREGGGERGRRRGREGGRGMFGKHNLSVHTCTRTDTYTAKKPNLHTHATTKENHCKTNGVCHRNKGSSLPGESPITVSRSAAIGSALPIWGGCCTGALEVFLGAVGGGEPFPLCRKG